MVVGNGIPDKAEFLMLQKALQDRLLTHAMKAGIVHRTAWEVWEDNWMQAQADLPGADARLVRVVAAYMTLGDYDSQRAGAVLAEALTPGLTLDIEPYRTRLMRYLEAKFDADKDGVSNLKEWEFAQEEEGLTRLEAFARNTLDGVKPVTWAPASANSGGGDADFVFACTNFYHVQAAPISPDLATISLSVSPTDWVQHGDLIYAEATVNEEDGYGFKRWVTTDGCGTPLTPTQLQTPIYIEDSGRISAWVHRCEFDVPRSTIYMEVDVDAPYDHEEQKADGTLVRTVGGPPVKNGEVTVTANMNDLRPVIAIYSPGGAPGDQALSIYSTSQSVSVEFIWGDYMKIGAGYTAPADMPTQFRTLNIPTIAEGRMFLPVSASSTGGVIGNMTIGYFADHWAKVLVGPEYEVVAWEHRDGTYASASSFSWAPPGDYTTPVIETIPSYTLNVEIEVEGTGNPDDLYIDISPRLATYPEGTEVTLTAVNFSACCHDFVQWNGKARTPWFFSIDGSTQQQITIKMRDDTTIKAIYKGDCDEETEGMEVLYHEPHCWSAKGYMGDIFKMRVTTPPPSGDSWDGLQFREHLCVLGIAKNLRGYW